MFKILLRNSLRSLRNQRPYSFINILGLTIGVSSVIVLITWVSLETSYENFFKDKDRLYRTGFFFKTPTRIYNEGSIYAPAGPEFLMEFPVLEKMVRFANKKESVIYKDKTTSLQVFYTDSTFFDIFSFELLAGDKKTCLNSPQGIVLTEKAVRKIYGREDPLGKELLISGATFTVTAIARDPPVNTDLQFECLAPLSPFAKKQYVSWDGGLTCFTYFKLAKGANLATLQGQVNEYMKGAINNKYKSFGYSVDPYFQKISDIHLDHEIQDDLGDKGSVAQILMFSGIGLLILLIACFNFVNLNTALAFKRSKEVSVRKIFGSGRTNIILYFVLESAASILIALVLACILVKILLPYTSNLLGKRLVMSVIDPGGWLIIFVSLFIFCTVFASFYSAFYLSSINPLALLAVVNRGKRKQLSRNILVTFQYTISIALIICCLVIYSQMQYIRYSDKGFNENNVLVINLNDKTALSYDLIRNRFASLPGVVSVSVSAGGFPGMGFTSNGYVPEGVEKPIMIDAVYVDENYLKTAGIALIEGRDFRNPREDKNKAIINQTLAKITGWEDPIGKTITRNGAKYEVIGMVKDFITGSLHNRIEPIFISTVNEWNKFDNVVIRYFPEELPSILAKSEKILKELDPQYPFEYFLLEDSILHSYSAEKKLNLLFLVLSAIAVFISCLGLFGMAAFSTQSRLKEISLRKINGAMISDVFWGFNFDLLKWILFSFLVAVPGAYYAMTKWLNNFAYKTTIGIWLIVSAGLFAIFVGMLTVSWAAMKAAKANPAEVLRKE